MESEEPETEIRRRAASPRAGAGAALLLAAAGLPALTVGSASAQQSPGASGAPSLRAAGRSGPVEIDGRLDEAAWERAPAASGFVQGEPTEGADPARPTSVRVLFDDEALYVGARMHDDGPGTIADQLVRRDEGGQYDFIEVLFDTNLDRQTGYLFRVSASGVELDAYLYQDNRDDVNWDAVWSSGARTDSGGWTAEMRIPLSQIRYESREDTQTWGVNFRRRRLASNSVSYFSLVSRTREGVVSQSGRLEGLRLPASQRRLQLRPFVVTELVSGPAEPGDPFFDGSELKPRAGVNAQYGIGTAFSLDATVNPDFGQVEVDPAVVNLTAFETFFPEKRPFFVQDGRIFDFELSGRNASLFFSRRIGREPHRTSLPGASRTDVADRTTILGATKLTGRTADGLSLGVLGAVTQKETGRALIEETGRVRDFVAEPAAGYGVARLQQDLRDGASRVGAILTGMGRNLPAGGALDDLPSSAFSGGLDFEHQWGGPRSRRWSLSGYLAASHVRGSRQAITAIQTNPQHYFQRPDADDLSVDSTATHLTGVNWSLAFARQSAEHVTWSVSVEELSPDFAINDLGFSNQGEQVDVEGGVTYRQIEPGSLFRSWNVSLFTFHEFRHELLDDPWSTDGWARAYEGGEVFLNSDFEFLNNWSLDVGLEYGPESLSDTETRGGPLMTEPGSFGMDVRLRTDPRRSVSLEPSLGYTTRFSGAGRELEVGVDLVYRPSPGFELSLEPEIEFDDDAAQYVTDTGAVPYAPTFGRRYVFADLGRTEFSLETRLDATFSPDLSLQLFLQPLLSAGDYLGFKQLARPSSFSFISFGEGEAGETDGTVTCVGGATCTTGGERYLDLDGDGAADVSFDEPDFNVRSLRGNAVLRWEYLPGSTLFAVWQHDRRSEASTGSFDLGSDLDALLDRRGENTFILKVEQFLDL